MPGEVTFLGLTAGAWSAVFAVCTLVATVWVAVIARRALDSWKKQVERDHVIEVSRQLVRAAVELKFEIERFRSQGIDMQYWDKRYKSYPSSCWQKLSQEIEVRWAPLRSMFATFEVAYVEAKVILTDDVLQPASHLLGLRSRFGQCIGNLVGHYIPEARDQVELSLIDILDTLTQCRDGDRLKAEVESYCNQLLTLLQVKPKSNEIKHVS